MNALTAVCYMLAYKQYCKDHNITDDSVILEVEDIRDFIDEQLDEEDNKKYMDQFAHHLVNEHLNELLK